MPNNPEKNSVLGVTRNPIIRCEPIFYRKPHVQSAPALVRSPQPRSISYHLRLPSRNSAPVAHRTPLEQSKSRTDRTPNQLNVPSEQSQPIESSVPYCPPLHMTGECAHSMKPSAKCQHPVDVQETIAFKGIMVQQHSVYKNASPEIRTPNRCNES